MNVDGVGTPLHEVWVLKLELKGALVGVSEAGLGLEEQDVSAVAEVDVGRGETEGVDLGEEGLLLEW